MKRMILEVLLMTVINIASFSREFVSGGKIHSAFGDYKIEIADKPVTINGEEFAAYLISYQKSSLEVPVMIKKNRKYNSYIVLSEKLSVQYVCNENYLGVERLDKSLEKDGHTTSDAALNRSEYFHQKVLGLWKEGEIKNTQLIAVYFKLLLRGYIITVPYTNGAGQGG